jgi:hypothetical protein
MSLWWSERNDNDNQPVLRVTPLQHRSGRQVTRALCKHLLGLALLEPVPSASVWVESVVKVRL